MKFSWKWFIITVITCSFLGSILLLTINPQLRCERTPMVAPNTQPAEPILSTCEYSEWVFGNGYIGSSMQILPDGNATAMGYTFSTILITLAISIWAALWAARSNNN